jgi:hypothetical protein
MLCLFIINDIRAILHRHHHHQHHHLKCPFCLLKMLDEIHSEFQTWTWRVERKINFHQFFMNEWKCKFSRLTLTRGFFTSRWKEVYFMLLWILNCSLFKNFFIKTVVNDMKCHRRHHLNFFLKLFCYCFLSLQKF